MTKQPRVRLWQLMLEQADGAPVTLAHLCTVALASVGVSGAAVTASLRTSPWETLYATDAVAADLEDLALTLGQGPGVDAIRGSAALVADLSAPDALARWPAFAGAAMSLGVAAVFAFPLQVGAIRLGVLNLSRIDRGELNRTQLADALALAEMACALVLDSHLATRSGAHRRSAQPASLRHPEIHQATGMVAVQLGVSVAIALVRLRAYAYVHDRPVRDVAREVVSRRLRFAPGAER